MAKAGSNILNTTRSQVIRLRLAIVFIYSAALSVFLTSIFQHFLNSGYWIGLQVFLVTAACFIFFSGILKFSLRDSARLLNRQHPALEESAELWIKDRSSLNILEQLQVNKIDRLPIKTAAPGSLYRSFRTALLMLGGAVVFAWAMIALPQKRLDQGQGVAQRSSAEARQEIVMPGIAGLKLYIQPPAYTRLKSGMQKSFGASFLEGSSLRWEIETTKPVKNLRLILNDQENIAFRKTDQSGRRWSAVRKFHASGFYQIELEGKLSELYPLSARADEPPVIRVQEPGKHFTIDFGQARKVKLLVNISDDLGIVSSTIQATVSSGKGEGVKFKEYTLQLAGGLKAGKTHQLSKTLDLNALAMIPGDELYFYIRVQDSKLQESRSDIHIVSLPDTAELMSLDGLIGGVNLVPEYFRSQRQIIIDTEKLIAQQHTISQDEFRNRSNNLGLDQKMLRLRYGKFLGEESETEIGEGEADHGEEHDSETSGDPASIMDQYAHKHDIAEDATFFEPELKAQLKAVLTEMWRSELKLRTHLPAEALPFEYKALRLLKDLQQQSRVYVAKTSYKAPPIKADKRLSGELDKIHGRVRETNSQTEAAGLPALRGSVAVLEKYKTGEKPAPAELHLLSNAGSALANAAAASPESYLRPLALLRDLIKKGHARSSDISRIQNAISRLVRDTSPKPAKNSAPETDLSELYFNDLNKKNR